MKQSVSRRFSLAIIGVVAVIVIGFTVVLVWDNVKVLTTALHHRLSLAADLADLTLALPLWELNFAQIQDFAAALLKDRDMVYANITDIYGKALATQMRPDVAPAQWEFFAQAPRFIARSYTIRYMGNDVGTLQLAVSKEGIHQELQVRLIWIADRDPDAVSYDRDLTHLYCHHPPLYPLALIHLGRVGDRHCRW